MRDPKKRLGGGPRDAEEIKEHIFFEGIDWELVYNRKLEVPEPYIKNNVLKHFQEPKMFKDNMDLNVSTRNYFNGWSFVGQP